MESRWILDDLDDDDGEYEDDDGDDDEEDIRRVENENLHFLFQLLLESTSLRSTRKLNHLDENKVGQSGHTW